MHNPTLDPRVARLAALFAAIALSACGGGDPASPAEPGAVSPSPDGAVPAPAPAPAPEPAPTPAPAPAPTPTPAPAPTGWGSVTVNSSALSADRVVAPNLLPTFELENSSSGAARRLSMVRSADPLRGDAGVDQVGVRFVAATGAVLSASVALVPDPTQPTGSANYVATCGPCTGISVDLAAGTVTFADTPLVATVLSGSAAPATLNGTYRIPDYRARSGTTLTGAALAACSVNVNAVSATFADIGCLVGAYVGTGIDGQSCRVEIDAGAKTFRFDDGVRNDTFAFSESGGYTNLGTFRNAFTQTAQLSRPNAPLQTISVQASPVAAFPNVTVVDLRAVQAVGGNLNSVYNRQCRLEFDRTGN
jgi:hypothetical protein